MHPLQEGHPGTLLIRVPKHNRRASGGGKRPAGRGFPPVGQEGSTGNAGRPAGFSVSRENAGNPGKNVPRRTCRTGPAARRNGGKREGERWGRVGAAGFEPALSRSTVWRPTELDEAPSPVDRGARRGTARGAGDKGPVLSPAGRAGFNGLGSARLDSTNPVVPWALQRVGAATRR